METKIFVIGLPIFDDVAEKISEAFESIFDKKPCAKKVKRPAPCAAQPRDRFGRFTSNVKPHNEPCGCHVGPAVPNPEWKVCGKPADENLRFGAEFAIDEPMAKNYSNRADFEYDHQLFDEFVSAGEDCVKRGLARPDGVKVTRCNAIRQRLDQKPPMRHEIPGGELIGETDWWTGFNW